VVSKAGSFEEVLHDEIIDVLFDELTKHQTAKDYVKYLFADILDSRFFLESIAEKALEDEQAQADRLFQINESKMLIGRSYMSYNELDNNL